MTVPLKRMMCLCTTTIFASVLAGAPSPAPAQPAGLTAEQVLALNAARDEGKELFRQRKYREAAQAYERALAIDSTDAPTYFNTGLSYQAIDSTAKALRAYRSAIRVDALFGPARLAMGALLLGNGRLKEAEETYAAITTAMPDSIQYVGAAEQGLDRVAIQYTNRAIEASRQRRSDSAEVYIDKAMQLSPDSFRPFYVAGNIHEQEQKLDEALHHYQQALTNAQDRTDRAKALSGIGRIKLAQARAAERNGGASTVQQLRLEGVDYLQQAVGLDSTDYSSYVNLGNTFFDLERYDDAKNALLKAEQLNPRDYRPPLKLAETYLKLDKCPEAEQAASRAIQGQRANPAAHAFRAEALECLGRKQDALAEYGIVARDPRWRQHALYKIKTIREELGLPPQQ